MFHENREIVSKLKKINTHFKKIFEKHNKLHDDIELVQESTISDFKLEEMKKEKLLLKDELYSIILKEKSK